MDLDDEQYRRRPVIVAIAKRLKLRGGDDLSRDAAAQALARYEGLSERTREAVLSYFPDEPFG